MSVNPKPTTIGMAAKLEMLDLISKSKLIKQEKEKEELHQTVILAVNEDGLDRYVLPTHLVPSFMKDHKSLQMYPSGPLGEGAEDPVFLFCKWMEENKFKQEHGVAFSLNNVNVIAFATWE